MKLVDQVDKKYEYLVNLVPRTRKRGKLPHSVMVLDRKLCEMSAEYDRIKDTASENDLNILEDRIIDVKSSITILIIGT